MDAVKFLKERKRKFMNGEPVPALGCDIDCNYEEVVKEIEEWSAAHPRKTRQSVFLEQYPNARVAAKGIVNIWPCEVEKNMQNVIYCNSLSCADCRREFWMQEVE